MVGAATAVSPECPGAARCTLAEGLNMEGMENAAGSARAVLGMESVAVGESDGVGGVAIGVMHGMGTRGVGTSATNDADGVQER